jgi:hypothetical protein
MGTKQVAWSHGGDRILIGNVVVPGTEDTSMWVVDLDDLANPVQVTDTPLLWEWEAAWSPDDSRIACVRRAHDENGAAGSYRDIVTMNPDGSGVTVLTTGTLFDLDWLQ